MNSWMTEALNHNPPLKIPNSNQGCFEFSCCRWLQCSLDLPLFSTYYDLYLIKTNNILTWEPTCFGQVGAIILEQ